MLVTFEFVNARACSWNTCVLIHLEGIEQNLKLSVVHCNTTIIYIYFPLFSRVTGHFLK